MAGPLAPGRPQQFPLPTHPETNVQIGRRGRKARSSARQRRRRAPPLHRTMQPGLAPVGRGSSVPSELPAGHKSLTACTHLRGLPALPTSTRPPSFPGNCWLTACCPTGRRRPPLQADSRCRLPVRIAGGGASRQRCSRNGAALSGDCCHNRAHIPAGCPAGGGIGEAGRQRCGGRAPGAAGRAWRAQHAVPPRWEPCKGAML